jgi:DNA-binding transcriptional ArsR family regulator
LKSNGSSLAKAADMAKLQDNAARACNLLKAMANPARLLVLCQIADGEKSVGELERAVGLSQSGLSQHLAVLRSKNLVTTRRDAQTIYYSLASDEAAAVMGTLYEVFCSRAAKQPAARLRARAA